jgi:alginate O-acetyltransferase complex protein AlgJ
MKRAEKIYTVGLTLLFLAWILVPFLNDCFEFDKAQSVSITENRNLARKPLFDVSFLDPYPAAYETWYKDHFVFREPALRAHAILKYKYFHRSPAPEQVDLGKDGWLFNARKEKLIYLGKMKMGADKVRQIAAELHARTLYYLGKGIHFYVCIAPMTHEIYPEYLPDYYFRIPGGTQTDQVIAAIRHDPVIAFIDLKSALIAAKKRGRIYQKTDNHWNIKGGFFVYSAIIERIKKDFPVLKPLTKQDLAFKRYVRKGGVLAATIGFNDLLMEEDFLPVLVNSRAREGTKAGYPPPYWFAYKNEYEVVSVTSDTSLPKLFVIRDSFCSYPMQFLRENFSKTVAIWDAWMYGPNLDLIEKEKPDAVLLMIYEPHLEKILTQSIH